jgi:hypothetical protein
LWWVTHAAQAALGTLTQPATPQQACVAPQVAQAPPVTPHAALESPLTQVPAEPLQPPLQGCVVGAHALEQRPMSVSHAWGVPPRGGQ